MRCRDPFLNSLGAAGEQPRLEGDSASLGALVADGLRPGASAWASLPTYLVHADVAFVTEHHLVAVLTVGRLADITHDVLVVLDAQTLFRLDGMVHVVGAALLKLLQDPLHGALVQLRHAWGRRARLSNPRPQASPGIRVFTCVSNLQ